MKYLNNYDKFSINESEIINPDVAYPEITDEDGDQGFEPIKLEEGDIVEVEGEDVEVTRILTKIGGDLCISFEGNCNGETVTVICDDAGSGYQFA